MIQKIHIHDCASYDSVGISLDNLSQINFLYGNNGTGKTTITNAIRKVAKGESSDSCEIIWKDRTPLDCFVYNKEFVNENFSNDTIPGVFTLGAENLELQQQIDDKRKILKDLADKDARLKNTLEKFKNDKDVIYDEFIQYIWIEGYKKYETTFWEAFRGYTRDKTKFAGRVLDVYNNLKKGETVNDENDVKKKYDQVFAQNITLKQPIVLPEDTFSRLHDNALFKKPIVGNQDVDIAALIKKLNNADWVHQGMHLLPSESEMCPFCQQKTITDKFRQQLESFFDESYIHDLENLKQLESDYVLKSNSYIDQLNGVKAQVEDNALPDFDIDLYNSLLLSLQKSLKENQGKIQSKVKNPSEKIELEDISNIKLQIEQVVHKSNMAIKENNDIVAHVEDERNNVVESIWRNISILNASRIVEYKKSLNEIEKGISGVNSKIEEDLVTQKKIQGEINTLQASVTSVMPTVTEINRQLTAFGFSNFSLVPTEDERHYQIKRRDGAIAMTTLSEGERTFITFMYFMQLMKGGFSEDKAVTDRVVIIDDPISSLDSTVLFLVSSLLKEEIKKIHQEPNYFIKQIFILTHNVYFFKETSVIDGRANAKYKMHYWILRKNNDVSTIQDCFGETPIHSSYELLWKEYKAAPEDNIISIQNIMRRIIEHYFKTLGGYCDEEILSKFENPQEREICRSLMCWVNDGSHCLSDDMYVELGNDLIQKYKDVFRKIFEKLHHESHYDMMIER